jgi:hypothetical protein
MQGDASGGEAGNGRVAHRKRRALLRRAAEGGIEQLTDPDQLFLLIEATADVQTQATQRLRTLHATAPESLEPDEYIRIKEVAELIHRSVSHIRHKPPDYIPGRRQECPGGRVEWSKRAVLNFRKQSTLSGI